MFLMNLKNIKFGEKNKKMKTKTINMKTICKGKCPNGHKLCLSPRCWLKKEKKEVKKYETT